MTQPDRNQGNRRLAGKLAVLTFAMFGVGFALVPLYDAFCKITGLNGKTGRLEAEAAQTVKVDTERWVTVEFTGSVGPGLPWEFRPVEKKMRVHPGEVITTHYYARNMADETIVGQAVPSVTPGLAGESFKKIECFCFTQQALKAKEEKQMAVQYVVQPNLPAHIRTITLSYTFFNADKQSAQRYGGGGEEPEHDHAAHVHEGQPG